MNTQQLLTLIFFIAGTLASNEIREIFDLFDKNKKGTVNTAELGTLVRALNLNPTETEIERYLPFLKSHIEIINPKILLLLGSTALNTIIGDDIVISKARGNWIQKEIGESKPWVIASFHPAFLMRQPEQKKFTWIDLKMIRDKSKILKI